jgi:N-acetylglucosamine-6-sulfatase
LGSWLTLGGPPRCRLLGVREHPRRGGKSCRPSPNIIFVLTEDLDFASDQQMPEIGSSLIEGGTSFENAFVSHPVCCPSRATTLTGLYDHNHEVLTYNPRTGASRSSWTKVTRRTRSP